LGGAAKWWLHGSLAALDEALRARSGELAILRGPARACIETLVMEIGASHVFWNRRYDAAGRAVDTEIKATLKARDIVAESFNGHLLHEPWTVMNQSGAPFRVFTAFWRAACAQGAPATPLPVPSKLRFHATPPGLPRVALDDLGLEPRSPDWAGGMRAAWQRGEAGAAARLAAFVAVGLEGYADARDRPDKPATSRLSPYLRFGNVSVRQVWHAVTAAEAAGRARSRDCEKFRAELGWREFSYNLLYHQPELATRNVRTEFDAMPWRNDPAALAAWQRGLTGYPIVDAGMRELWTTGWMHNRVRMVVASFLTKHLLIDWRAGEAWFWDTLVDADTASNAQNWQWVAGSGADAAPYFRIFNPVLQGEKFDPDGDYVRRWVPELAHRTADVIHHPVDGGVDGYPQPIVDHAAARKRALDASKTLKRS
jgi:deoxyribodipyrimidine photo-lyase